MTADDRVVDLARQLRAEIGPIIGAVAALVSPSAAAALEAEMNAHNLLWARRLLADDADVVARTAIDLMCVRWPDGTEPPTEWWATPLGQVVAASTGHTTSDVVSYAVAGAMLGGVSKQYVNKLVRAGHLQRGPDDRGVTRDSIRARLHRTSGRVGSSTTPGP